MDNATPSLLPILRSRQQGNILALLLGESGREFSLTDVAEATGAAYPSVHREIERAENAGIVSSRKVGNTRLVRANSASPYFKGLAEILTIAFGVPFVLEQALQGIPGITQAFIYGSWASHQYAGQASGRPVHDIDVLILGVPERDEIYQAAAWAEKRLVREVNPTIRAADWLRNGSGGFRETLLARPMVELHVDVPDGQLSITPERI